MKNYLEILRLNRLEKEIEKGLTLVSKIKLKVSANEVSDFSRHFLDKGYSVESCAEVWPELAIKAEPIVRVDYYLEIKKG